MMRDEQAAEAGHRREAVERHPHDGAAGQPWSTMRLRFEGPEDDIHAVLGGGADDERKRPDVHQIEPEPGHLHDGDRPQHSEDQRHQRERGLPQPVDHEPRDPGDEGEGVEESLPVRPLDEPHRLVCDNRLPRDIRIDGSQFLHEPRRARAFPDVQPGVDLEEQAPVLADELPPQLVRQIAERDRRRPDGELEPSPLLGEVVRDARLELGERGLDSAPVARPEPRKKGGRRSRHDEDLLREAVPPAPRAREIQPALQGVECRDEPIQIERAWRTHADAVRHGSQALEQRQLLGLAIRHHREHALDVRDGGQALERPLLRLELRDRPGRRERGEPGAARAGGDLPLPDHRLGAVRLEIQQVVIEAHPRRGPQRGSGHQHRGGDDGLRIAHEPFQRGDVARVMRSRRARAAGDRHESRGLPPAVDQQQGRGKDGQHRQKREKDRGAGDEPELADAAKLGDGQDVEGRGGGEGAEEHAGAASHRGALERVGESPTEHTLFPIPEQEVNAVVDPDADDDRDEHHRVDREMADEQRDDAHRPAEAHREHGEHRARGHEPPEREHEQTEREDQGQDTGDLTVPGGGAQLVGEERGHSRDAGRDRWELRAETRDRAPDGDDRRALRDEGARRIGEIDHDVEEATVVGEEVAVGRGGQRGNRDEGRPG